MPANLKNPKRPFVMRQRISSEPYHNQLMDILHEMKEKKSTNGFNLELRLRTAMDLIKERDDLMEYATALERQRRALRRQLGKDDKHV